MHRILPSLRALCWMALHVAVLVVVLPALAWSAAAAPPAPMLAGSGMPGGDIRDYWASEKLDGVRGRWNGRTLQTRSGNRIDAPAWFVAGWPGQPMDGELWIGRGRFDETSAVVRRGRDADADWRRVRFMVFDLPTHPGSFGQRVPAMRALLRDAGIAWLQPVEQRRVADRAALDLQLKAVVAAGGEGLMLHHDAAFYRSGRSDQLVKLKPHDDAEAVVVAHLPGNGKYTGMLGALLVELPDGRRLRLGSGLSDAQRRDPPGLGARVTYRYSGLTSTGLPRFARFLRVRDDEPLVHR